MKTIEERFWSKVTKTESCWLWTGAHDRRGYGSIYFDGRSQKAHRVAWFLTFGEEFPKGMDACHHCDHPPCVRPDHIFPGTARDNALDAVKKGCLDLKSWLKVPHGKTKLTHCKNGHEFNSENTTVTKRGHRSCNTCMRTFRLAYYHRNKNK